MEQFFQFKHTDTVMCFNQLTFIHCKLLYTNRQYTSSGMLYPKCYHVCRGHRSWLLSEATVAHLGLHQFQYCRQNHETLRLPAESRRSFVHTKHATFVLCLFWTTVLPKGNQNGVPVRSGSTRASGIQVKWDTSDCPLQSSSVYRKIPHEVSIIVGWSDRIYIAMVKWDSWYRVGQALQYVTYNEQSHFTNLWG